MPNGSLKNVECDVSRRMAFKVFTARDPRRRQRIAAPLLWIACRALMAGRDLNTRVAPWAFSASTGESLLFLRERTSTGHPGMSEKCR